MMSLRTRRAWRRLRASQLLLVLAVIALALGVSAWAAKADGAMQAFRGMSVNNQELYLMGYVAAYSDLDTYSRNTRKQPVMDCKDLSAREIAQLMSMSIKRSSDPLNIARLLAFREVCGIH